MIILFLCCLSAALPASFHRPVAPVASAVDTTVVHRIDIEAQPLRSALERLVLLASLRVTLDGALDAALDEGVVSRPIAGRFTGPAALRAMLAGLPFRVEFTAPDVARIIRVEQAPQALGAVHVSAAAHGARYVPASTRSATRTDTPLRDVPQSVTVLTRALIKDQAMQSMSDAARVVPGVSMAQGEGHRDAPTIRGMSSTADFFVDGVRDDVQYLRDLYNADRLEVLKGPNAMAFGRGGGGGVINRVTRSADWSRYQEMRYEGGSFAHRRGTMDVGDALTGALALRLTGVTERSGSYRDHVLLERSGINPTAAMLVGGTLVRASLEAFDDRRTVDRGQPSLKGRPLAPLFGAFFGNPSVNRARAVVRAGGMTIEHGSLGTLQLRNVTRVVHYDKFYQNTVPGAVNTAITGYALSAYRNATDRLNTFNQTDLTLRRHTGVIEHTVLAGAEFGTQATDNFRETGYFDGGGATITVPLGQPTVEAPVTFRQSASDADNRTDVSVAAVYVQHQASLGRHWQTVAGVRWDRFALRFDNRRSGATLRRTDLMLAPRAGVVFKPVSPLSLYGSWSVSQLPSAGDQFASLTATTQALEPERFTNREAGFKWDVRPALLLEGAAYHLDRTNSSAPDPVVAGRVVQTGRARSSGVELRLSGNITGAWQVTAGFAAQTARIASRTTSAPAGATTPLVPSRSFSAWNRVQLTRGVAAAVGLVRQGATYASIDNAVTLPGWTRADVALFVDAGPFLRMQLNVENVWNRRYAATSQGNNGILPGAPRTVRISIATRSRSQ